MRRNTEEVKSELFSRLDEYNKNRRRRRRVAASCLTVALVAAVTVAAVPNMIAGDGRGSIQKMPVAGAPAVDKIDDVTDRYLGADGESGKENSAGLTTSIDGIDKGSNSKDWQEDITEGIPERDEASAGEPSFPINGDVPVVIRRDRDGNDETLSAKDAAAVVEAVTSLELKKMGDDFGSLVVRLEIKSDDMDIGLELNDRNEAIVYARDGIYVAENTEKLINALKNAGVIE